MNRKTMQKINKVKLWFFENINEIDKPLAIWSKNKKKTQVTKVRKESVDITTNLWK